MTTTLSGGAILAAVALGGSVGAVARHLVNIALRGTAGVFPLSTLVVNIAGSLIVGMVIAWANLHGGEQGVWRGFVQTGLLGSLTTFSTFSVETLLLVEAGRPLLAGANVALNLLLCLIGCWLGLILGRVIW